MKQLIISSIIVFIYSLTANAERVDIPFTLNNGLMIIEVEMDGKIKEFVFDTGSNDVIIHQNDKEINEQYVMQTMDGTTTIGILEIEEMHIGDLKKTHITATTMDLSYVNQFLDTEIGGMIGSALFSPSNIMLDFANQLIILDQELVSPNTVFDNSLQYYLSDGVPTTSIHIGDNTYQIILDSGATTHFFDPKVMTVSIDRKSADVFTATGSHVQQYGYVQDITLGSYGQEILNGVSKDFEEFNEGVETPIIGLISLKKLVGKGSLYFDTDKKILFF